MNILTMQYHEVYDNIRDYTVDRLKDNASEIAELGFGGLKNRTVADICDEYFTLWFDDDKYTVINVEKDGWIVYTFKREPKVVTLNYYKDIFLTILDVEIEFVKDMVRTENKFWEDLVRDGESKLPNKRGGLRFKPAKEICERYFDQFDMYDNYDEVLVVNEGNKLIYTYKPKE